MARSNVEEREMVYLMPNGQPVVVRNQGQEQSQYPQESRKACKQIVISIVTIVTIAIFVAITLNKRANLSSNVTSTGWPL